MYVKSAQGFQLHSPILLKIIIAKVTFSLLLYFDPVGLKNGFERCGKKRKDRATRWQGQSRTALGAPKSQTAA